MAIHDNFAQLALRLINKNGRDITVRRTVIAPGAEPWKPSTGTPTVTNYTVKGVFSDADIRQLLLALPGESDQQTLIPREQERQLLIPALALPIVPTVDDEILDGSKTLQVTRITPIMPGPTPVVWVVRLAR